MIEREYLKYNASIQTGSNADHLLTDSEGNVEAKIELRLPDNLFSKNTGTKKVDKVELQASKFRISMQNTPLAQIPLDTDHLSDTLIPTKCELDIYPFCLLDDNKLFPDLITTPSAATAFPNYKNHKIKYIIYYIGKNDIHDPANTTKLCEIDTVANNEALEFPKTSTLFEILKKAKVLRTDHHIMQLCAQTNHEPFNFSDQYLYIKNMGTLEQMWQDALQNAMTYAMTSSNITLSIWFIRSDVADPLINGNLISPVPDKDLSVMIDGQKSYLWKFETTSSTNSCPLVTELKPIVHFDQQSFSIAYDSVAFPETIPIAWNPPFVETGDHPEQLTIDTLRSAVWTQPPPKRQYLYDVTQYETSYNFNIDPYTSCLPMNIIANKETKERFSFLPWIEVDTTKLELFKKHPRYHIKQSIITKTITGTLTFADVYLSYKTQSNMILRNKGKWYRPHDEGTTLTYTYQLNNGERINQTINWGTTLDYVSTSSSGYAWIRQELDDFAITASDITTTEEKQETICEYDIYEGETPQAYEGQQITTKITIPSTSSPTLESGDENKTILAYYQVCCGKNDDGTPIYKSYQCFTGGQWDDSVASGLRAAPPDWLAVTSSYDETTHIYTKTFLTSVQDGTTGNNRTPIYFVCDNVTVESGYTKKMGDISYQSSTWEYQQSKTEVTVINADATNYWLKLLPNLSLTDDKFYIIDGTTADVDIGSPEMIKVGPYIPPEPSPTPAPPLWDITTTISTFKEDKYIESSDGSNVCREVMPVGSNQAVTFYQTNYPSKSTNGYLPSGNPRPGIVLQLLCDSITNQILKAHLRTSYDESSASYTEPNNKWFQLCDTYMDDQNVIWTEEQTVKTHTTSSATSLHAGTTTTITMNTFPENQSSQAYMASNSYGIGYYYFDAYFYAPDKFPPVIHLDNEFRNYRKINTELKAKLEASLSDAVDQPSNLSWNRIPIIDPNETIDHVIEKEGGVQVREIKYIWYFADLANIPMMPNAAILTYSGTDRQLSYFDRKLRRGKTVETVEIITHAEQTGGYTPDFNFKGNVHLTFNWNNLPVVVLSPIQSIVLQLTGMTVNHEFYPINIQQKEGSSLTSTIPIIENYYSLAATLRDLHDELVVSKQSFDDTPVYSVTKTSGEERSITLSACYITKDGSVHQIYIPKNGVFTLQLTFGISFYTSS